MGPTDKIWIKGAEALSPWDRLQTFLAPYDLRLYVTEDAYLDIGSCSLGCVNNLSTLHQPPGFAGCLGSIGRFCEFSATAEVIGRADHDHDKPVNISFRLMRDHGNVSTDLGMKETRPFWIGHNVVLSSGAKILPGLSIGDGAVVGAGSVVTRDIPPLAIVAGSPARAIRSRPSFERWWNFAFDYLLELGDGVQEAALSPGPHRWRSERPRFVLRQMAGGYQIIGFSDGDEIRHLSEAPLRVREYLTQAFSPGLSYLTPDCWS